MNSNLDLRVERCLQLLAKLKQTVAKFAQREELLVRDLSGRRHAINRTSQETLATKEAGYTAQLGQVETYFRTESQRIQKVYDTRQERINRYASNRLRNLPRLAQEMKSHWKGELQMRNFQAQRKMTAELAEADADYPGFNTQLQAHWKNLLSLEKQAKSSFRGYLTLLSMMGRKRPIVFTEDSSLTQILKDVSSHLSTAEKELYNFQDLSLPRFFSRMPLWAFFLLTAAVIGGLFWLMGMNPTTYIAAGGTVAVFVIIWIIHAVGYGKAKPLARSIAHALVETRQIIQGATAVGPAMAAKRESIRQEIEQRYELTRSEIDAKWGRSDTIEQDFEQSQRQKLDAQMPRLNQTIDGVLQRKLAYFESQRIAWHDKLTGEAATAKQQISESQVGEAASLTGQEQTRWEEIVR